LADAAAPWEASQATSAAHPLAEDAPAVAREAAREDADDPQEPGERAGTSWLEENRALWVEPGYLILLRWRRPDGNAAVIAALEASAEPMTSFLTEQVQRVDQLHNVEQLHPIEQALARWLAPRVAPASLEVIHLDHDCTAVCALLEPSRRYPERLEIMGEIVGPEWE
jgi:hypothetical protein